MNIQAMMKQAQKLQKDMMNAKKEIDETEFECTKSFITVKAMGNKKIKSIKIDMESISKDEVEMVEDLMLVAVNELMDKIDKETEKKMGKYTQGMPGLF
ncbi:MAG TPA: YbaB/EbfC family nucleoid-associated protein [Candidatus Faecisoma merdavium]|nr:YbaB/EbfC family nucleoid-associated protein [Candidatus Faecisoma merdavium]